MRRHPNRKRLEAWLDGAETSPDLDAHLDECEKCAATIEAFAEADGPVQSALKQLLMPPEGLRTRVEVAIAARAQTRSDLEVLGEMLGIGLSTERRMFDGGSKSEGSQDRTS
ncbi:MAG: putative anti-sigma-YlaC factor YlaD [Candidatus Poriferisodalaceae bacterium]|jgi:predicted anti-sigma-YlaC factor YlaD